jgi:hypothetical protein
LGAALAATFIVFALVQLPAHAIVAGAGFTTYDKDQLGCNDSPNGIDCNNYDSKDDVYMSGGPNAAGVSDGSYYFAVLTPGSQSDGFIDGNDGNLSDTTSGATAGDNGSGDDVSCRTFTVTDHQITDNSSVCAHAEGESPNGRRIIQLSPYDDTDNPGGVYILAICETGADSPSQCKFDAFRIQSCPDDDCGVTPFGTLSGKKYYDANANGQLDGTEVGIAGWEINIKDSIDENLTTDTQGDFSRSNLVTDEYTLTERQPTNQACVTEVIGGVSTLVCSPIWIQSGNTVNQSSALGASTVSLLNFVYTVDLADADTVSGLYFGNVCTGPGGGLTLGFWSNKNGQKLFGADDLALMVSLNLRNANGSDFDPASYATFRTWLLNAKATNMAYMLSAQLAAMELNVLNNKVNGNSLIYAPGTTSANSSGFATVSDVMNEANTELGAHGLTKSGSPYRSYQEALKTALDRANNNLNFVQSGPANCPTPTFAN